MSNINSGSAKRRLCSLDGFFNGGGYDLGILNRSILHLLKYRLSDSSIIRSVCIRICTHLKSLAGIDRLLCDHKAVKTIYLLHRLKVGKYCGRGLLNVNEYRIRSSLPHGVIKILIKLRRSVVVFILLHLLMIISGKVKRHSAAKCGNKSCRQGKEAIELRILPNGSPCPCLCRVCKDGDCHR